MQVPYTPDLQDDKDLEAYKANLELLGIPQDVTPPLLQSLETKPQDELPSVQSAPVPARDVSSIVAPVKDVAPSIESSAPVPTGLTPDQKDMAANYIRQKYGIDDKYSADKRQALVDQQKQEASKPNWLAGLAALGAGLAGRDAASAGQNIANIQQGQRNEALKQFDVGKASAVEDEALKKQAADRDPNSPQSVAARNLAKSIYEKAGIPLTPDQLANLSAADTKDPNFFKPAEFKAQLDQRSADNAARREELGLRRQEMSERRSSDAQNKALTQTQQLLESARGNPAAAQAEKDLYAVQKAKGLFAGKDPNKLSPQEVSLLVSEVSKIAQGGVPTTHEMEALNPGTVRSKFASFFQKYGNEPSPAHAGEFIKMYSSYLNGLERDAKSVIQDKYGRVIESRKGQLGEDNYKALQDNYVNRFAKSESQSESQSSKVVTQDTLKQYAQKHGISVDEASKALSKAGYEIR